MKKTFDSFPRWIGVLLLAITLAWISGAIALTLESKPPYLSTQVTPNVFFLVDDSGSMDWDILTVKYWTYDAYWGSGTTTIDNTDTGAAVASQTWSTATDSSAYGSATSFRYNTYASGASSGKFTYTFPSVPQTGSYDVYAWWPNTVSGSTAAATSPTLRCATTTYSLTSSGSTTTYSNINQTVNGGQWNKLGTVSLTSGNTLSMSVTNPNNTTRTTVVADAVKIVLSTTTPSYVTTGEWRAYNGSVFDSYNYVYNVSDNVYYGSSSYPAYDGVTASYTRDWRIRSTDFNVLYYDPSTTYQPWPGMANATFTAARSNPQPGSTGYALTKDLTGFVYEVWSDTAGFTNDNVAGTAPQGVSTYRNGSNGLVDLWDNHTRYTINASSIQQDLYDYSAQTIDSTNASGLCASGSLCIRPTITSSTTTITTTYNPGNVDGYGRTLAQVQQNIANWYQYYRRRHFVAKAAIGNEVTAIPGFRYGLTLINDYSGTGGLFVEMPSTTDTFSVHNNTMLQSFYSHAWQSNSTPLRVGLDNAGQYYSGKLSGHTSPITNSCQQNFTILFTDGYWNESSGPSLSPTDQDGDGYSSTLADVAYKYYFTDLRSDLTGNVPVSRTMYPPDVATWQHMVTFGVSIGIQGNLRDTTGSGWPSDAQTDTTTPPDGKPDYNGNWGNPNSTACSSASGECPERLDDLWHAAFNGHGAFVAAQTPGDVQRALDKALSEISARTSSASSAALNTGSLSSTTRLYQARFDSGDWSGDLLAYSIDSTNGNVNSTPLWQAKSVINAQNFSSGRAILSYIPASTPATRGTPIPFRWASLNATQQGYLNNNPDSSPTVSDSRGSARLDYLRGDRSGEGTNTTAPASFRPRSTVLGDIIHSDPVFVGKPSLDYPDTLESSSYSAFKTTWQNRMEVIFVGSNDGMLHGFNAANGQEVLAYVPSKMFAKLNALTSQNYTHRYFVDGKATVSDAYGAFPGCGATSPCWRSILVGILRGGGQGIFALDVTDPAQFTEANANKIVLWEFNDFDDDNGSCSPNASNCYWLGYSFSQASIVKLANGQWAAVLGNGYNNTEADGKVTADASGTKIEKTALMIINLATGALIKKIDTAAASIPTGMGGLSTPALIDTDGDYIANYAYAGDLIGNLWKFDLSSTSSSSWGVANSGHALFTATPPSAGSSSCLTAVTGATAVISDNTDTGNGVVSRTWTSKTATDDYGTDYLYNSTSSTTRSGTFKFNLPTVTKTGTYDLYAWWHAAATSTSAWTSTTSRSSTTIYSAVSGTTTTNYTVNQKVNGGQWNKLGTLTLTAGNSLSVSVINPDDDAAPVVIADAVKIIQTADIASVPTSQPITVRPEIARHPDSTQAGYMVYFGTGKYLEDTDGLSTCAATQSFYAVWDQNATVTRGQLLAQTINSQVSQSFAGNSYDLRILSNNSINWASQKGWYLDIIDPTDGLNHGEKIYNTPVLTNGRVIFTSSITAQNPCDTTEGGWLYEADWASGGRLNQTFDLTGDSLVNDSDKVTTTEGGSSITVAAGGKKSKVGIPTAPSILEDPTVGLQFKYVSGSLGGTPEKTTNAATAGVSNTGRQSWRQLFAH